jgi:hypothetical protein
MPTFYVFNSLHIKHHLLQGKHWNPSAKKGEKEAKKPEPAEHERRQHNVYHPLVARHHEVRNPAFHEKTHNS